DHLVELIYNRLPRGVRPDRSQTRTTGNRPFAPFRHRGGTMDMTPEYKRSPLHAKTAADVNGFAAKSRLRPGTLQSVPSIFSGKGVPFPRCGLLAPDGLRGLTDCYDIGIKLHWPSCVPHRTLARFSRPKKVRSSDMKASTKIS